LTALSLILTGFVPARPVQAQSQRPPTPGEGRIEASGKFVPASPAFIERTASRTNAPLTNLTALAATQVQPEGEGRYRLGVVRFDAKARTITFPAQVNQREGLLEYAVVTREGKLHEALLATDAQPLHVHLAALLLGLTSTNAAAPPTPLRIEVEWKGNGPVRQEPLENLISRAKAGAQGDRLGPLPNQTWHYTGSSLAHGALAADLEGSLITLIRDPVALATRPVQPEEASRRDGVVFVPNAQALPSLGLAVTVRLQPAAPSGAAKP
jgi:hypothetical protein